MNRSQSHKRRNNIANILLPKSSRLRTRPIYLAAHGRLERDLAPLSREQRAWLQEMGWQAAQGNIAILPGEDGQIAGAVLGIGDIVHQGGLAQLAGKAARQLPPGAWRFHEAPENAELACLAWLLGSYSFARYCGDHNRPARHLKVPKGVDRDHVLRVAEGVILGRDLINTPANDMGPEELAEAAARLAGRHGAEFSQIVGDDLLEKNFPLLHAVGRASSRPPRLIELKWGNPDHPRISLAGKGICFDSGGLNLKPGNSMALMKKDMGGAATALSLGMMIMSAGLPVRLHIVIPAADNSISGNAFRPGDVIESRNGISVEIGNTDAEGRLVLADGLALASEKKPDMLICLATLTGAARVALGAELPPLYADDDEIAASLQEISHQICDPLWRMPLWKPYERHLRSKIADINHISDNGGMGGSITAALFLRRFAQGAGQFIFLDIYGWVPSDRSGKPRGGEPQGARALFEFLRKHYPREEG